MLSAIWRDAWPIRSPAHPHGRRRHQWDECSSSKLRPWTIAASPNIASPFFSNAGGLILILWGVRHDCSSAYPYESRKAPLFSARSFGGGHGADFEVERSFDPAVYRVGYLNGTRRNCVVAGHDARGERAAASYTGVETALCRTWPELNDVDPSSVSVMFAGNPRPGPISVFPSPGPSTGRAVGRSRLRRHGWL